MNVGHPQGRACMKDLIITENITLDGVVEATDNWFGPAGSPSEVDQSDHERAIREQREAADAFLVGRVTYEQMRSYWPQQTDDTTGITDYLNKVNKYVVSSTLRDPQWDPTTVLRGAVDEEIRKLKALPGRDIVVTGSIALAHALIAAELVDEFRLFVYPVVVGRGRRLFPDGTSLTTLHPAENRQFRSGVTLLRYRTA
jgi:dihydrofolate reductase